MDEEKLGRRVGRVLIYRLGSLGDTLVALPCFHLVARVFPDAERRMLTNYPVHAKAPAAAAVLGESGLVHGYMRYTAGTRSVGELLRLAVEIRRLKPDVLVYMMSPRAQKAVRRDALFFRRVCGIPRIVGLPTGDALPVLQDAAGVRYESEAARLERNLRELGESPVEDLANWDLRLTEAERETSRRALEPVAGRPLLVVGPGTKMQAKDWGRERWRALLDRLRKEYPEYAVALIGARDDGDVSEYASEGWAGARVNLCGRLTPRETAAVIASGRVFLGPDSGPMHLAAAVGTPCVIAFSARGLPGVWFPVGRGHQVIYHRTSCFGCELETCLTENRRCLEAISVEEMAQAVARVLSP